MFALREERFGELVMRRGRRGDAERVARVGRLGQGIESAHAIFRRNPSRRFHNHVANAGKFNTPDRGQFGVNAGVFLAE